VKPSSAIGVEPSIATEYFPDVLDWAVVI
jgi:hypothetical protein